MGPACSDDNSHSFTTAKPVSDLICKPARSCYKPDIGRYRQRRCKNGWNRAGIETESLEVQSTSLHKRLLTTSYRRNYPLELAAT